MEVKKMLNGNADNPLKHAAGLSAVWQRQMSEFYAPQCRTLIDPEHGKLKRLKQSLGMKKATEVVEYAIRNWGKFAQQAAKTVASDIVPPNPSVGWLCKYHAIALMMLHEELQSIAKKQAEEEQAKKLAQVKEAAKVVLQVAAHNAVKEKPATLEEIEAIEAEVEAEFAAKEKLSA